MQRGYAPPGVLHKAGGVPRAKRPCSDGVDLVPSPTPSCCHSLTGSSSASWIGFGVLYCDSAGMSVAGVGDVNADGLADVAVGAPQSCSDAANPGGVVYVVHGSRGLRGGSLPAVVRRGGCGSTGSRTTASATGSPGRAITTATVTTTC